MKQEFFISVLVPVYNVEPYVGACIDSILAQGKDIPFEVVLVDDGSTDKSGFICDRYQSQYPEIIKVIHKENAGLISARRVALKHSTGKYIVWVDSDDTIESGYFSEIVRLSKENDSDMFIFRNNKISENGRSLKQRNVTVFDEGIVCKDSIFAKVISSYNLNQLCRKVCKRSLYDIEADYSHFYHIQNGEDLIQSMPLFLKANSFYYSHKAFYNYRVNTNSLSRKVRPSQYKNLNVVRVVVYEYMLKAGYDSDVYINKFFNYYADDIWDTLFYYINAENNKIDYNVFSEIVTYPLVVKAREYLKNSKQKKIKKRGLVLFFNGKWDEMVSYFKFIGFFVISIRRFKTFVANKIL